MTKLTPEQAIEFLKSDADFIAKGVGKEGITQLLRTEAKLISALIESLAADAELGRAAVEIIDTMYGCDGKYNSKRHSCQPMPQGCMFQPLCRLRAGKGGE